MTIQRWSDGVAAKSYAHEYLYLYEYATTSMTRASAWRAWREERQTNQSETRRVRRTSPVSGRQHEAAGNQTPKDSRVHATTCDQAALCSLISAITRSPDQIRSDQSTFAPYTSTMDSSLNLCTFASSAHLQLTTSQAFVPFYSSHYCNC